MRQYTLQDDGDPIEKKYYSQFLKDRFPSYEAFWRSFIAPLTKRPTDIRFKEDADLEAIGKGHHDICVAQLHYTILLHLARCFEIMNAKPVTDDGVLHALTALCGAQDIAFELLQRLETPKEYDPWKEGKDARIKWQKKTNHPLQLIRDYRNDLVHGRMFPVMITQDTTYLPAIGKQSNFLDWRKVMNVPPTDFPSTDYVPPDQILSEAWKGTVDYLECSWQRHLLPKVQEAQPRSLSNMGNAGDQTFTPSGPVEGSAYIAPKRK